MEESWASECVNDSFLHKPSESAAKLAIDSRAAHWPSSPDSNRPSAEVWGPKNSDFRATGHLSLVSLEVR